VTVPVASNGHDIIVFDALCVFCTGNAKLVIRHDKARRFKFAAMQDATGRALLGKAGVNPEDPSTLIVVTGDRTLYDSDAVLHIYRHLGWPWRLTGFSRLIPKKLRDPAYRLVARNRYRWFGRRDECWVPSPQDRERLL
jgi:predicted DCC family thiol-disulfide oxidoreductase YuxK